MRAPLFWKDTNFLSTLLLPAAGVYGFFAARRQAAQPQKVNVPVICIGNLVAGGAGKTPVALALGEMLKAKGKNPHYLSRGYKGTLAGPVQVNTELHSAREVGDEPLLLAQLAPTWVSRDRVAGAKAAIAAGADIIVMDDGFQNPSLHKDVSIIVIDGEYGFGNKRILPAGPLREPVAEGLKRAQAIVIIGDDTAGVAGDIPSGMPVLHAHLKPRPGFEGLKDKFLVAFAGIARPRKFYRTLQQLGGVIKKMVAYPDHHQFSAGDIAFLKQKAVEYEAMLVTTTKDYVRLSKEARADVTPVAIEAVFENPSLLLTLVP